MGVPPISFLSQSRTATTASISTVILRGSHPTPMADREWRPASPRMSTKISEQPLMTRGCSVKSGVVGIPTAVLAGPLFSKLASRLVVLEGENPMARQFVEEGEARMGQPLPGFGITLLTVLLPVLLLLATGAGSLILSHVNDGGFWLVKEYFNMTVAQTFKTWTVRETLISITALVLTLGLPVVI
ncbi:hypothetical protein FAZ69_16645 [Trinickia terrae]|uniref:Uncharacterized protein n=1 Tax=Trinickia terrae TaxID=2571161 RepID=A0A4U1I3S9_9BURK|nr:hypothetical protein FAZ69_16645 [Trinickia terrae]